MTAAFIAFLLILHASEGGGMSELYERVAAAPPSVRDLIERRALCNHWGGEEPYDAGRKHQIDRAWLELRCVTVRGEAIFLRRYFASSPDLVALIDATAEESGWPAAPPGD